MTSAIYIYWNALSIALFSSLLINKTFQPFRCFIEQT